MQILPKKFFLIILAFASVMSSCSTQEKAFSSGCIQKRKYSGGFHVDLFPQKTKVRQHPFSPTENAIPPMTGVAGPDDLINSSIPGNTPDDNLHGIAAGESEKGISAPPPRRYRKNGFQTPRFFAPIPAESDTVYIRESYPRANGFAIAGFICSITGWLLFPLLIVGFIFSIIGLSQINREPERWTGSGFAIAGIVFGAIGLFILLLIIALLAGIGWYFF